MKPTFTERPTDERRSNYEPSIGAERYMLAFISGSVKRALTRFSGEQPSGGKALDVGCGAQPFRAEIEKSGCRYTGFDVVQNGSRSVDFIGAIDESLPAELVAQGPFDLILCTEVLEHVADWHKAFSNFSKLLAPKGRLIITCPHVWPLHEIPYDFWRPTLYAVHFHAKCAHLAVVEEEAAGTSREVLYTVLAGCPFKPRRSSFWCKAVRIACVATRRLGLMVLRSRWLDNAVEMDGKHYLSTFAVLTHDDCKSDYRNA